MMTSFSKLSTADLSYVDPIPPTLDIECPVCFGILFEPYLSDCCGHHFCGTCIPNLKDKPCPLCKKSFSNMLNLSLQRQIGSVKIYCPLEKMGCEWTGEMNSLKTHEQQCLYVLVECKKNCGKKIQRSLMDGHLTQHCPKRPAKCLYCSDTIPFNTVTEHMKNCPEASVSCPNSCNSILSKRKLPEHMNECPLEEVECEFAEHGCQWKKKRKFLENHLNENWRSHNSSVIDSFNKKISCQEKAFSTLRSQVTDLIQTKVKTLENNVETLRAEFENYEYESEDYSYNEYIFHFPPPPSDDDYYDDDDDYDSDDYDRDDDDYDDDDYDDDGDYDSDDDDFSNLSVTMRNIKFTVGEISERRLDPHDYCFCPEFYTDRPGYKMSLMVQASGCECRQYLSVFLAFVRGAYDCELWWPFRGEITIRLCSQVSGLEHYEKILQYTSETSDYNADIPPGRYQSLHYGFPKFISYQQIEEDNRYFDNDRLTFEITRIAYKE